MAELKFDQTYGPYFGRKDLQGGMEAVVVPLLFGKAKICAGRTGERFYNDEWHYENADRALAAMERWDGSGEPDGWFKHPPSERRRVLD